MANPERKFTSAAMSVPRIKALQKNVTSMKQYDQNPHECGINAFPIKCTENRLAQNPTPNPGGVQLS